jgi:transposase
VVAFPSGGAVPAPLRRTTLSEGECMFAEQVARAIEVAHPSKLVEISTTLWRAYAAALVTEDEASALSDAIEARRVCTRVQRSAQISTDLKFRIDPKNSPTLPARARSGSRPRTDASMARRRSWAAAGRLPPAIAARFTLAEQAVLAVVAFQVVKHGACTLTIGAIAALAGVSATSVRNAIREAKAQGLVSVEERKRTAWMNYPNVVRIVSADWASWLRLHGCRLARPTNTQDLRKQALRDAEGANPVSRGRNPRACADRERARKSYAPRS